MVLKSTLNFTFSLLEPPDNKWGGKSKDRTMGWNGMVGDIAEGTADLGVGPFTITHARSEVITYSFGWINYVKTFFLSAKAKKAFHYTLFLNTMRIETWIAMILIMTIAALLLSFIVNNTKEKQIAEFSIVKCFTFSVSGVSFVRRWSVTPVSIPARIAFITILLTGVLTQVYFLHNFFNIILKYEVSKNSLGNVESNIYRCSCCKEKASSQRVPYH